MTPAAAARWTLRATAGNAALQLLDEQQVVRRTYPAASLDGRQTGMVRQVLHMPLRRSFLVSFARLRELWEISYSPDAPVIHDGLVHDHRMGEALAQSGFLGVRRIPLEAPVTVVYIDPDGRQVLCQVEDPAGPDSPDFVSIHLDARTVVSRFSVRRTSPDAARQ